MQTARIIVGALETNCYLLWHEPQRALVIDPGADAAIIVNKIAAPELTPIAIVLTHGHYDHIAAAREIADKYGIPILAGECEIEMLAAPEQNFSAFMGNPIAIAAKPLTQDFLAQNGFRLKILDLPGHTPGAIGLLGDEFLVSGDAVFAGGGIGRTDLPGGDAKMLAQSIEKIIALPDELILMPGHGGRSILGREKALWRDMLDVLRENV